MSVRLVALLATGALGSSCALPCEVDADCAVDMHCGAERVCTKVCEVSGDCADAEFCDRGRCVFDARPELTWLEPADGAEVGERFDVEVEVRFRAASVTVELVRNPQQQGEPCAPLVPRSVVELGDPQEDVRQRIVFADVESLGETFGLEVRAQAPSTDRFVVRRSFHGPARTTPEGAALIEITSPQSAVVEADGRLAVDLEATLSGAVGVVSAWLEPLGKPPTPRRVLGDGVATVEAKMPLARGPQVLWLESSRAGVVSRCGVGLDTLPSQHVEDLEVGVAFDGEEASNLDLWIYADLDEEGASQCSADQANGLCAEAWSLGGLRTHGEEAVLLPPLDGIYGVAVASAAATDPVSTFVRVSNRDVHLGFFGPRSVLADQGQVWLAGRILVLGGSFALEPVDVISDGLPQSSASTW